MKDATVWMLRHSPSIKTNQHDTATTNSRWVLKLLKILDRCSRYVNRPPSPCVNPLKSDAERIKY